MDDRRGRDDVLANIPDRSGGRVTYESLAEAAEILDANGVQIRRPFAPRGAARAVRVDAGGPYSEDWFSKRARVNGASVHSPKGWEHWIRPPATTRRRRRPTT